MIVIPLRQLRGAYGTLVPGREHNISEELAKDLLKRGLVVRPSETKAITPPSTQDTTPAISTAPRKRSTKAKVQG
jgi:hypothetical protein